MPSRSNAGSARTTWSTCDRSREDLYLRSAWHRRSRRPPRPGRPRPQVLPRASRLCRAPPGPGHAPALAHDDVRQPYSWSAYDPVVVPDLAADFFATPLAHEPGSYFRYTGIGPYVAARALRAATGANVRDYLLPRLFTPLAIHNPQWHTCPLGHPAAETALYLRTSELARFGRLLLDEGRHEGRQLVPAEYCARIAAETVPTVQDPTDEGFRLSDSYGLSIWCTPGETTYKMAGLYGQLCIISPDKEAVVTVTAHVEGNGSQRTSITALIDEEIVARL